MAAQFKPEQALATVIGTGVAGLTLGTNLFYGPMTQQAASGKPSPAEAVFVIASGGVAPRRVMGTSERQIGQASMLIHVRGDRDQFTTGLELARQVRDVVQNASLGVGYLDCMVTASEPTYLGQNDNKNPEWSISAEIMYEET